MISFIVCSDYGTRRFHKPYDVYEYLENFVDTMTAIEASSWCELACIDDIYWDCDNRFDIVVSDS